jgi:hypothetical protein
MTIHKIGKVETLPDDLTEVFLHLGAGPDFLKSLHVQHQPISDLRAQSCLTSPETDKLRLVYARDFERFGYSTAMPTEA